MLSKALQIIPMFGQNKDPLVLEIATSKHSDIFLIYLNSALVRTETMHLAMWLHAEEPFTLTSEGCAPLEQRLHLSFPSVFSLGAL